MGRVIAVVNHKGGVGKTTTAENLAVALHQRGYRVIAVDADANGDLTCGLGFDPESLTGRTIYDLVITGAVDLSAAIQETRHGIHLIPANDDLAAAEVLLLREMYQNGRDWRPVLKPLFSELRDGYDYVIVDCPPNLGVWAIAILVATDEVLIPCACQYRSYRAIPRLLRAIRSVQHAFNAGLRILGIVPTMYAPAVVGVARRKTGHSHEILEALHREYGARGLTIFDPIKHSVRFQETAIGGEPGVLYAPEVAEGYSRLAERISRREQ